MLKKDIIIVGQGIAGSALVWHALEKNLDILVIDTPKNNISSNIAAGLYNPITGRTFQKTWLADNIFPYLENFYKKIESKTNSKMLFPKPIIKPFWNKEEYNFWIKSNSIDDKYIQIIENQNDTTIIPKYGAAKINHAGYIDVKVFLEETKKFLIQRNSYLEDKFDYELLELEGKKAFYKNIIASKIIFCEGIYGAFNPFFKNLTFRPVKGEIIIAKNTINIENIYNREIFILPKKDNVIIGSTYNRIEDNINKSLKKDIYNQQIFNFLKDDIKNLEPSPIAYNYLIEKFNKLIDSKVEVKDQKIGIRPCTLDRKPFVGFHSEHKNIGILNGLGTKGVSLAPFMANCLINIK